MGFIVTMSELNDIILDRFKTYLPDPRDALSKVVAIATYNWYVPNNQPIIIWIALPSPRIPVIFL